MNKLEFNHLAKNDQNCTFIQFIIENYKLNWISCQRKTKNMANFIEMTHIFFSEKRNRYNFPAIEKCSVLNFRLLEIRRTGRHLSLLYKNKE